MSVCVAVYGRLCSINALHTLELLFQIDQFIVCVGLANHMYLDGTYVEILIDI